MEYNNTLLGIAKKEGGIDKETLETAVKLISPFAPHIAEELWSVLGHDTSVFDNTWPVYDEELMKDDEIEIAIQINGKTKGVVMITPDEDKDSVLSKAKEAIADKLTGNIIKEIYVPGKIVNIVVK
jgi:leucyl-tRNA synthetase